MTTNTPAGDGALQADDWTLDAAQTFWMFQHHDTIEAVQQEGRDGIEDGEWAQLLKTAIATDEFKTLFGDMGFDEAYDRYLSMMEAPDPRDAELARLTAENGRLRAALGNLLHAVETNCMDDLKAAATKYTEMGYPHLDRQDAAIYRQVLGVVQEAQAALDKEAQADGE